MQHEQQPELPAANPEHTEPAPAPETLPVPPRIYVARPDDDPAVSLGAWLDATDDPDDLAQQINGWLDDLPVSHTEPPTAGDWIIRDYQGFGLARLDAHEDLAVISRLAKGIAEHGPAFSAWADVNDSDLESWDRFAEAYLGEAADLNDYGEQLWDDIGWQPLLESVLPPEIARHSSVLAHRWANDLWMAGTFHIIHKPGGGIWVFRGDI